MFCPECGSLMFPREGFFKCSRCDCEKETNGTSQTFKTKTREREIAVIDSNAPTLPKTRVECPKCGHYEAFWVLRQTRAADEPETRIYRCTECGHSWREY
ncbi:MAG: transcription factor S [Methanomassiliicoccales archaeon]|nr:transcription factor S [Methanomassiliicoccales archaeon]NYT14799.1 transcription factor S [Methanomassiliicoccales archaeon]